MTPSSQPDPTTGADRRVAPRFQPAFGTIYRFKKDGSEHLAVGLVWNISQTGISMLLPEPPERGGIVPGELTTETGGPGLAISLRVVHVRTLSTGDFLLGAQFSRPLDDEEMKPFLTPPPRPQKKDEG
jgi:hypothetical protein